MRQFMYLSLLLLQFSHHGSTEERAVCQRWRQLLFSAKIHRTGRVFFGADD